MLSSPQRIHWDIEPSNLIIASLSTTYPFHFASISRSKVEPPVLNGSFAGYHPESPVSSPKTI